MHATRTIVLVSLIAALGLAAGVAVSVFESRPDSLTFAEPAGAPVPSGAATVSTGGAVPGVALGTATITAASRGKGGTATAPWLEEDFSRYTSTANMLDPKAPWNDRATPTTPKYMPWDDTNLQQITLDTTQGYGASDRSMRYDYPPRGCESYTITRNLYLPGGNWPYDGPSDPVYTRVKELWIELVVKFSQGFTTKNPLGCVSPPDYKWFYASTLPDGIGRFAVNWGSATPPKVAVYSALNADYINQWYGGPEIAQYSDMNWHIVRVHWKIGDMMVPNTVNTVWIDGVKIYDRHDVMLCLLDTSGNCTGSGADDYQFYAIKLGANKDQGLPDQTQSVWWGRIRAWNTDPGW